MRGDLPEDRGEENGVEGHFQPDKCRHAGGGKEVAGNSQLQAECQASMLRHFYQVSQAMPPEQGRRYLAWVQEKTILAGLGQMDMGNPGHKMP